MTLGAVCARMPVIIDPGDYAFWPDPKIGAVTQGVAAACIRRVVEARRVRNDSRAMMMRRGLRWWRAKGVWRCSYIYLF